MLTWAFCCLGRDDVRPVPGRYRRVRDHHGIHQGRGERDERITTTGGDDWIDAGSGNNANVGERCETFGT
jgi:hypothetical protein